MHFPRPNLFEINLNAIAANTQKIRALIGPDTAFFATLKANAYGYGVLPAAKTVLASGADAVSLASLDDAISLRKSGIQVPILLYAGNLPTPEVVAAVEYYKLIPTIHNRELLQAYSRHTRNPLSVAVKIDVGPERIGVPAKEAADFVAQVESHPLLSVQILNAHPNVRGGDQALDCLKWQQRCFEEVIHELEQRKLAIKWRVMASSKVLKLTGRRMLFNAVDPGAALFDGVDDDQFNSQAFFSLKSALIEVRHVERQQYLDEAAFQIRPDMRIGIIPFGYSDGVQHLHHSYALIRGQAAAIIGKPALEYLRVDVSDIPDARVGDEVVLIGRQADQIITPESVMQHQNASRVIDLALQVGPSIERRYLELNKPTARPSHHATQPSLSFSTQENNHE